MYLLNNFKIDGTKIKPFHTSPLLHKGRKFKQRMLIFMKIVEKGYKIADTNLHSAVMRGINMTILDYMFSLPDENWVCTDNFRIPFLMHHIIRSDQPNFFLWLFKRYVSKRDPVMISKEVNEKYKLCSLYPLQTLTTDYKCMFSKVEPILMQNMVLSIHVTKLLIDHGADPYHDPCILEDQEKVNPKLADFMKSYAQQKDVHKILKNLLMIEKRNDIQLPFHVMMNIATGHMAYDNPYSKKFIDNMYKKYYS
jgi:hypothetical protein